MTFANLPPHMRGAIITQIAIVSYQALRNQAPLLGMPQNPPWHEASDELRDAARRLVEFRLANPDMTAEHMHDAWLQVHINNGWRLGPTYDPQAKLDPRIRPFNALPLEAQLPQHLFLNIVDALTYSQETPPDNQSEEDVRLSNYRKLHPSDAYPEGALLTLTSKSRIEVLLVTGKAWEDSGLSIDAWNELPQDEINAKVAKALQDLRDLAQSTEIMGATEEDWTRPKAAPEPVAPVPFDGREPDTPAELVATLGAAHEAAKGDSLEDDLEKANQKHAAQMADLADLDVAASTTPAVPM